MNCSPTATAGTAGFVYLCSVLMQRPGTWQDSRGKLLCLAWLGCPMLIGSAAALRPVHVPVALVLPVQPEMACRCLWKLPCRFSDHLQAACHTLLASQCRQNWRGATLRNPQTQTQLLSHVIQHSGPPWPGACRSLARPAGSTSARDCTLGPDVTVLHPAGFRDGKRCQRQDEGCHQHCQQEGRRGGRLS